MHTYKGLKSEQKIDVLFLLVSKLTFEISSTVHTKVETSEGYSKYNSRPKDILLDEVSP